MSATGPESLERRLGEVDYLAGRALATALYLAVELPQAILLEGEAGVGKTEAAKALAAVLDTPLLRLQCYEGIDAAEALYEWNYPRQLLSIRLAEAAGAPIAEDDLFGPDHLLARPLLQAIEHPGPRPVVLLIDEVDRVELETEALLLEILSEYQVSIPELGTVRAKQIPMVFLTSNNTRELSEALKRRCLYLYIGYPTVERERDIIVSRVPGITSTLAEQIAQVVRSLRTLDLKKAPSVAETLDWARTLVVLGRSEIGDEDAAETLHILLKYQTDIERATKELLGRSTSGA